MENNIADLWRRLERFASQHMPGLVAELNGPASSEAITRLEKELGFKLPADFVSSLAIHDGEDGDGCLLDEGGALLSLEAIDEKLVRERRGLRKNSDLLAERRAGAVKPALFHALRVPFIDLNQDVTWLLDFDPAPGGAPGQVVRRDIEDGSLQVVAASFSDFLSSYVARLEQGRAKFDSERAVELAVPPVDAPSKKEKVKRFHAALKAQGTPALQSLPNGAEVDLIGYLGLPTNAMGVGEYPFQVFGSIFPLDAQLGITRQDIMAANIRGDLYMFRIKAVVSRKTSVFGTPVVSLTLVSYVPFD